MNEINQPLREALTIVEAEGRERYLDHLERVIEAHVSNAEWHRANNEYLAKARAKVLAMPLPRYTCPGCFSAIYEGAAEQGWCCDCFERKK